MEQSEKITRYLGNCNEVALFQIASQLLNHPASRPLIMKSVEEFDKFYRFPIDEKPRMVFDGVHTDNDGQVKYLGR